MKNRKNEEAPKRRDDSYWLTPEQKKLAEEINAMRDAGLLLGDDQ